MPRPRTEVGRAGEVNVAEYGTGYRARTRVRDADGKLREVSATGASRTKARANLRDKLAKRNGSTGSDVTGRTRVRRAAELFIARRRHDSELGKPGSLPQTVDREELALNNDVVDALGDLALEELTPGRCENFVQAVIRTGKLAKARAARGALIKLLDWAVRLDAIPANVARLSSSVPVKEPEPVALTPARIAEVRSAVRKWRADDGTYLGPRPDGNLPAIIDTMLGSGLRIGEALALRWRDVDLHGDVPTVTVTGTMVQVKGTGLVRQPKPKSKMGWRAVPVPAFVVNAISDVARAGAGLDDPVFATRNGTFLSPSNVGRQLRATLKAAKIRDAFTPHMLRSTVGTTLARAQEAGLDTARAVLGHSATDVTVRHYVERVRQAPDVSALLQALVELSEAAASRNGADGEAA
jgi:integrase